MARSSIVVASTSSRTLLGAFAAGGASLTLFWLTLAPGVYWGDSAEFQRVAATLELSHPTGYPLYAGLAYLWSALLPWGSIAWRTNLSSAVTSAAAVGLVFWLVARLTKRLGAGALAAAFLVSSPSFWSQAVIAEVYGLHALLLAILIVVLVRGEHHTSLAGIGFVSGLLLSHHRMSILVLPGLGVWLIAWWHRCAGARRYREIAIGSLAFVLALTPYVFMFFYWPWHDSAAFIRHVFPASDAWVSTAGLGPWLANSVAPLVLEPIGVVGVCVCGLGLTAGDQPRRGASGGIRPFLGVSWALGAAFLAVYQVPDGFQFAGHTLLIASVLFGLGAARIAEWVETSAARVGRRVSRAGVLLAGGAVFLVLVWTGVGTYALCDRSEDRASGDRAEAVLRDIEPEAVVVAGWLMGQVLSYLQQVEGSRPDAKLRQDAARTSEQLASFRTEHRPVYLWAVGWEELAAGAGCRLETLDPDFYGSSPYPNADLANFDSGWQNALAANRGFHRLRCPADLPSD
jgi:hypothetical protein